MAYKQKVTKTGRVYFVDTNTGKQVSAETALSARRAAFEKGAATKAANKAAKEQAAPKAKASTIDTQYKNKASADVESTYKKLNSNVDRTSVIQNKLPKSTPRRANVKGKGKFSTFVNMGKAAWEKLNKYVDADGVVEDIAKHPKTSAAFAGEAAGMAGAIHGKESQPEEEE